MSVVTFLAAAVWGAVSGAILAIAIIMILVAFTHLIAIPLSNAPKIRNIFSAGISLLFALCGCALLLFGNRVSSAFIDYKDLHWTSVCAGVVFMAAFLGCISGSVREIKSAYARASYPLNSEN